MRRALALFLTLLLLPSTASAASAPEPIEARGPDEEGGFVLVYDVTRAVAGNVTLRLHVSRDDAGDVATAERDLGTRALPSGVSRLELPFLPVEGPGDYAVSLSVNGQKGAPLAFRVAEASGASTRVAWTVPDAPTYVNLTSDTVNADAKQKAPGEALITRAKVSDANGMGDLDALEALVTQAGAPVDLAVLAPTWAANATSVDVEHRFTRSPIAAGTYALTLRAMKDGRSVAEATRTFVIKEVAPTFVELPLPEVVPDAPVAVDATLVLADRNGWNAATALEARVYRGSTRLDGNGAVSATLGAPAPLPDADGAARVGVPLRLALPMNATPGAHRVSVYADGALLGSSAFDVRALPALLSANASRNVSGVAFSVALSGAGLVTFRATDGNGTATSLTRDLPAGESAVLLEVPQAPPRLAWNVTLRARVDGPPVGWASGELGGPAPAPALVVTPLRAPPRAPAIWRVEAEGWSLAGANATVDLRRWDGAAVAATATFDGGQLTLDVPGGFEPGRYTLALRLRLANGTLAESTWSFEAAPWLRIELGEPVVTGSEARIPVRNVGGATLRGLAVEVRGASPATLEWPGGSAALREKSGRHVADRTLAPGESATLVVRLPEGPQRAGVHAADIRVLALGARA